jgi:hypothetical protein
LLAKVDDMSAPIKSRYGWHIIKCWRIQEPAATYDASQGRAEEQDLVAIAARRSPVGLHRALRKDYGFTVQYPKNLKTVVAGGYHHLQERALPVSDTLDPQASSRKGRFIKD